MRILRLIPVFASILLAAGCTTMPRSFELQCDVAAGEYLRSEDHPEQP